MHTSPQRVGSKPYQQDGKRTYFPELDGVRAVAIAMVLVFHLHQDGLAHIPGPVILGQTGVDLFFVLSGFLITGILIKASQYDWHEVKTFYIRRSLRIFPIYYLVLFLLFVTGNYVSWTFYVYLQNWPAVWIGESRGPAHLWSLAVEEQFYLVWPFVVLFMRRSWLKPILVSAIVLAFLVRFPLIWYGIGPFTFTISRLDSLSAGALLSLLLAEGRLHRLRSAFIPGIVAAAGLLIYQQHEAMRHPGEMWEQTSKFTILALFYSMSIGLLLVSKRNVVHTMLASRPFRFVGRISYGLYVYHPFCFAYIAHLLHGRGAIAMVPASLLLTFLVSLLSWYGLERHLILLKDRLAPERARFSSKAQKLMQA